MSSTNDRYIIFDEQLDCSTVVIVVCLSCPRTKELVRVYSIMVEASDPKEAMAEKLWSFFDSCHGHSGTIQCGSSFIAPEFKSMHNDRRKPWTLEE
jgi:hypothetical protein